MGCGICGFFQKGYLILVARVFEGANTALREFVMEGRTERAAQEELGVSRGEGVGEADVRSGGREGGGKMWKEIAEPRLVVGVSACH